MPSSTIFPSTGLMEPIPSESPVEFAPPLKRVRAHSSVEKSSLVEHSHPPTPVQDTIIDQTWLDTPAYHALRLRTQGKNAKPVRLLGISLFDGVGSFWQLFSPFEKSLFNWVAQFSSETDPKCMSVLRHRFPKLQHLGDVRELDFEHLQGIIYAHSGQFDAVVLAGGSPCQQISAAGLSKDGLAGKDSSLFWHFTRVAQDVESICRVHNRPLWRLFENVVGTRSTVDTMSQHIGFAPVHVDAADFGWTSRKRLVWCDAFVPDEWKEFINTESFPTHGWHTLNIPRRRRKLPPLGSIF